MSNYPPVNLGYPTQYQQYQPQQYQPRPQYQPIPPAPAAPAGNTVQYVTSRDEVLSRQIPFDGSTAFFFDTACGKIYTKTFDPNTGTAPIMTYAPEVEKAISYATVEDLNAVVGEINRLKEVFGAISIPSEKPKHKGKRDDDDE